MFGRAVKSRKAFVSFIEMIIVLITLFIAFNVFFPGFSYKNRWTEAMMKLKTRDLLITADTLGKFYPCGFSPSCFKDNFLDLIIPTNRTNIIPWTEVEGTVKNQISISCNCTPSNIQYLYDAFNGLTINGREINAKICYTDLESVNPCMQGSDLLVIWGYKDISSTKYRDRLRQYLSYGGIVEVMDIPSSYNFGSDYTQQQVFGITGGGSGTPNYNIFLKPASADQITYQPYKFFYHTPLRLLTNGTGISTVGCTQNKTGVFTINTQGYPFSICNGATVFFDTDNDKRIDSQVSGSFKLYSYGVWMNFTLKYVSDQWIKIRFDPSYELLDFAKSPTSANIMPVDDDYSKVLLMSEIYTGAVIVNGTNQAKTAWVADFSRDPAKMGDDHKNILLSLILALSNKNAFSVLSPNVKTGFLTSYLNVNATDMYEILRFNLGLGYPY